MFKMIAQNPSQNRELSTTAGFKTSATYIYTYAYTYIYTLHTHIHCTMKNALKPEGTRCVFLGLRDCRLNASHMFL